MYSPMKIMRVALQSKLDALLYYCSNISVDENNENFNAVEVGLTDLICNATRVIFLGEYVSTTRPIHPTSIAM